MGLAGPSHLHAAWERYRRGDLSGAKALARGLLKDRQAASAAEHLLALCALREGDAATALRHAQRAARGVSAAPDVLNTLGMAAHQAGQGGKAIAAFVRTLRAAPSHSVALLNLARTIVEPSDAPARVSRLRTALREARGMSGLPEALADRLLAERDEAGAAALLRAAIALSPGEPVLCLRLAGLSYFNVPPEEGLFHLAAAAVVAPDQPEVLTALAARLEQANRLDEAKQVAARALAFPEAAADGRVVLVRIALRRKAWDEAAHQLEAIVKSGLPEALRPIVRHLQARLADGTGRIAEAIALQAEAKAAVLNTPMGRRADPAVFLRRLEAYERSGAPARERPQADREAGRRLVFLVGFPRSGTTLMERILAAHGAFAVAPELPLVTALSEQAPALLGRPISLPDDIGTLTDAEAARLAAAYLREMEAVVAPPDGAILVDKMPLNMVELPLIERLFPKAQVVTAVRDPRDVVVSCYMNLFAANHATAAMGTPEGTARLYDAVLRSYVRQRDASGLPVHEYRYEDLVQAPRPVLAVLLEALGVPWTERVLAHHLQDTRGLVTTPSAAAVAGPITGTAVGRWQRYAPSFGDAFALLGPWVASFGYGQDARAA